MIHTRHLQERYRVIIGYVGTIFIGIAFLLLLPLIAAVLFGESDVIPSFLISAVITAGIGLFLRNKFTVDSEITLTIQEGGIIVLLAWIGAIGFSSLPFLFSGTLNFTQAIFEATSGWTTTGLSVIDVTQAPKSFLLWRSIMQFIGGAGFSVLMLSAVIGPLGLGLFNAEGRSDKLLPNVTQSAKMIMTILISYAIAGVIMYMLAGMPWFDALNHALCALSTGGFSTQYNSIGEYNRVSIELVSVILMILGATSFAAHYLLLNREFKEYLQIAELRLLWILLLVCIPLISFVALKPMYHDTTESLRVGIFQVVSSLTTTGFSTVDLRKWGDFPRAILGLLMIIGGMAGSTAGGIKLYRVVILFKSMLWNIQGYFLPRNVIRENQVTRPDGPVFLKKNMIIETTNFITMYFIFFLLGMTVFMLHGHSLTDSMFEIASTLSTVGLSIGITAADAPVMILWTQTILMLMGRLEFFVVFFAGIKVVKDMHYLTTHPV